MARPAAKRGQAGPGRPAGATRRAPPDAAPSIRMRWGAVLGGLAVAYIASVALGLLLARLGLASNLSALPLVQFLALFLGGYVAGRWAVGRAERGTGSLRGTGFMNGVAVAVGFIAVWAVQNAVQESWLVQTYGPLALPRMNIPGIMLGDLLSLSAAAAGGWLAERG